MTALRLAVSWLTVLPVRGPATVDGVDAGRAIALAPVVGVLLGGMATAVLWLLTQAGAGAGVAGLVAVAGLALLTRGMHLDGLADTFDGLGTYGPPERAREVMKSGGAGPFGVAAIVFAVGVQALSFAALADAGRWVAVGLAVALGRVAVVAACRRGVVAAPGTWFGAQVAGTQSPVTIAMWVVVAAAAGMLTVPGYPWLGPLAVLSTLAVSVVLVRHCLRRTGGLSGDVLGAAVEVVTALAALGLAFGR
ncbi:adenosylcobinamide-GDP ribazoletransferase [Nocardia donostiensis]|uniref:Adenosylcobinamide-GDP ribazoletransferase n=1 Tax=Nocardia donostiensis TaxID=1538463 RepID=A0A1V2T9Q6_9NOCA|nr:adenosylcobinamide-GDP ribazoletransferase [Nocardia donostiensis]ONM46081.1 adenosylcobinamide-GDP ribazoletransferase [Nocardia donostiensis]OQS12416.1 adenosylcobinamide-GDP ribazoletransferase [Nocardia donostiensis]OQS17969.1 adenosylcobinamide-GDP ribazoletransferase [Nocardia donostiensis]